MALFNKKKDSNKNAVESVTEDIQVTDTDTVESSNESTDENVDNAENKSDVAEVLEERDMFDNTDYASIEKTTAEIVDEIIDYFTQVDPIKLNMLERGKLKKEDFVAEVKSYIKKNIKDKSLHDEIYKGFSSFIWSYDILDDLIADDEISDIKVYDWNHIRLKRLGKREGSNLSFRSERHYNKFVEHVAIKNKVSISDQNAAQNFVDKESSQDAILRFNVTTGFINSSGKPVMHIRKIPKRKMTEQELIKLGFFDEKTVEYLKKRVIEGGGFLLAGKGGSGKTTFINWLIEQLPEDVSGLVIQENEELFSSHPDIAFEHTVQNRGEGKIEYNLGDLARNGLLTDIDYFIIGEIKGAEAIYLLNAVYTGAKGWATVHGASAKEAMKKLVDYIKYNSDYSQEEALQMLVHLDTIVFMDGFKVKEIAEVVGYDEDAKDLIYKNIL